MRRWRPSMSASSASAPMRNESTSRTPPMGISEVKGEVLCECTKRSEEHTSELQSQSNLVCRLLLEKKKQTHHGPPRKRPLIRDTAGAPPRPRCRSEQAARKSLQPHDAVLLRTSELDLARGGCRASE